MKSTRILVATVGAVLAAVPCFAHDTWLLPRSPLAEEGKVLLVDLTSGMAFPRRETAIKSDRVASSGWRTGAGDGSLETLQAADSSLVAHVSPVGTGTAVIFLSLKPNKIEMGAADVTAYFEEIGAPESLRREWAAAGPDAKFQETYTKHTKAFVRMGDEESEVEDKTCLRPVGFTIEFIPQRDPTTLSVGDSLVVKAVGKKDELESFAVGVVCGETGESQLLRTNQAGFVGFTITEEGWWLVKGTLLRRKSDGTFNSDFTTMTFYVDH
jgi:uncharacterized GH25 family protein